MKYDKQYVMFLYRKVTFSAIAGRSHAVYIA